MHIGELKNDKQANLLRLNIRLNIQMFKKRKKRKQKKL